MGVETLIAVLVIMPFAAALLTLVVKDARIIKPLVIASISVLMVASVLLLIRVLESGPIAFSPGNLWDILILVLDFVLLAYFLYIGFTSRHPLILTLAGAQAVMLPVLKFYILPSTAKVDPVLYIDLLSVIMALVISIIGGLIIIYALDYMRDHEAHLKLDKTRQHIFFFFMIAFLGAMNGLVFANSLLWLFFFWEVTTLCSFHLIRHDLNAEAIRNALRALWMNLLGGAALVLGMILLWQASETLAIQQLMGLGTVGAALLLPIALFCFTGFTKAAQVPFQSWLLGAMVAPTPVSALLHSSTMVKAGVYLVLRLAPAYEGTQLSVAIAIFGAFVFMVTSVVAISQNNAKRVLAYSTVSNLGLIICCAGINSDLAIAAAIALIVFHAVSKAVLFLVVGSIEQRIESRDIEDMEGLVAKLPLLSGMAILGMVTMLFVPFGVLFGKWASIQAAAVPFSAWFPLVVGLLAIGSATTMVYWTKWIGRMISVVSFNRDAKVEPKSFLSYTTILLMVAGAVVLSVFVAPLVNILITPAESTMGYAKAFETAGWHLRSDWGLFTPWPLFIAITLALLLPALLIRVRGDQYREPYLCGANDPSGVGPTFHSIADQGVAVRTGGAYWEALFGERGLTNWINGAALLLLVVLFVGVFV
ncbi:MAG: NADH-quinone oxidoreductase subunit L [Firmicutes bacterium]|nr:NADH-quinone oxidoreductase subunit L [Bacillota bacterium]MBU4554811.1 NADH-quinone oxidoreductase subunit L [Bacillota bacterium]MBV1726861.1 NADH-quinone oxidoreductase subunit L [Desulforudis sp.]MBV1736034.1 NADH-quinone oxidoreductase subunit L [Desulforudis sp.]MBV1768705.1 NADH-quinone oxidoreductase subunit L [Desulforudis sp.]